MPSLSTLYAVHFHLHTLTDSHTCLRSTYTHTHTHTHKHMERHANLFSIKYLTQAISFSFVRSVKRLKAVEFHIACLSDWLSKLTSLHCFFFLSPFFLALSFYSSLSRTSAVRVQVHGCWHGSWQERHTWVSGSRRPSHWVRVAQRWPATTSRSRFIKKVGYWPVLLALREKISCTRKSITCQTLFRITLSEESEEHPSAVVSVLSMLATQRDDQAIYSCVATNEFGKSAHHIQLTVLGKVLHSLASSALLSSSSLHSNTTTVLCFCLC